MKKNKVTITTNLLNDIEKYTVNFTKGMAEFVKEELVKEAESAINLFYQDYNPISYKRHFYNFREKSFKGYYKNPHNQIIRGGLELTPYLMDDIYSSSKKSDENTGDYNITEYIFNLVYSGYHGNMAMIIPGYKTPVMNPSPLEIILDKRDYITNNINSYRDYGFNRVKGEAYSTLQI